MLAEALEMNGYLFSLNGMGMPGAVTSPTINIASTFMPSLLHAGLYLNRISAFFYDACCRSMGKVLGGFSDNLDFFPSNRAYRYNEILLYRSTCLVSREVCHQSTHLTLPYSS